MAKYKITGLPKAQTGLIKSGLSNAKNLARMANIGTIGTANTLAKTFAPIMINPIHIPTFGMAADPDIGLGPFTGSPLNILPIGKKLSVDDESKAFRKFGDTLDYVKLSRSLDPSHGPLLRMGKSQIVNKDRGNWAALGAANEAYPGVFAAEFNFNAPGANLGYGYIPNRRGVLITDAQGKRLPKISIDESGLSFHRRLPFSNRYIPVNMDKLRNDEFDWRTIGGNTQSLLERYGYAAGLAGLAGAAGFAEPQEYLDKYVTDPVMNFTNRAGEIIRDFANNPFSLGQQNNLLPTRKKGGIKRKRTNETAQNWSGVQPQIVAPGQDPFALPGQDLSQEERWARQEATYPMLTEEDLAWQDKVNRFDENLSNTRNERFNLEFVNDVRQAQEQFANSGKYDKLTPIRTYKGEDVTPEMEQAFREAGFLPIKDKKTGNVNFYLQNQIASRIINNGLRTDEIVSKLGIGDKETINKEFGSLMGAADQQYEATVIQKVLNNAIEKGISVDEAFNTLPKSLGLTDAMRKKYLGKSEEQLKQIIQTANQELEKAGKQTSPHDYLFNQTADPRETFERTYYTKPDGSPDWEKINARGERMEKARKETEKAFGPDLVPRTPGRDSDQFSNYPYYYTDIANNQKRLAVDAAQSEAAAQPFNELLQQHLSPDVARAFSDEFKIKSDKALAEGDYGTLAKLVGNLQNEEYSDILSDKDLQKRLEQQEFERQQAGSFRQGFDRQRPRTELSTIGKIQDMLTYPMDAFRYSVGKGDVSTMWDNPIYNQTTGEQLSYRDLKELNKQGYGADLYGENLVGDALNTFNPFRLGYESRKNVDAGRYGDLAFDLATTLGGPSALKGLKALGKGVGTASRYSPIKSLPGLNAGNALNAYFGYETLKDDGLLEQAYDQAAAGNYGTAAGMAGLAGINLLPYTKAAKTLFDVGKTLTTPGRTTKIATNLPFSAAYKSPIGSGVAIQNPSWTSNTQELLPGFTSKFNKVVGPTFGEIKLYGTGTKAAPKSQNLLTGSASTANTVNQIPSGRNWKPFHNTSKPRPVNNAFKTEDLSMYEDSSAIEQAVQPYPIVGKPQNPMSEIGDASFAPFSPGYNAMQAMGNLATYGKQPLLKPSDFATEREIEIDRLFNKNRQGIDSDSKDFSAFMKEAEEKGFTPDEVLNRIVTRLGNTIDPARQSQRDFLDRSKPFNLDTRNRDIVRQGPYNTFGKELNEYGPLGGKSPSTLPLDPNSYEIKQIKRLEDFLNNPEYNMTPEQRTKIRMELNKLYQKNVGSGLKALDIDINNPATQYNPGLKDIIPNFGETGSPAETYIPDISRREYDKVAAQVVEDMRAKKIDLWQTPEGQKRLQDMIDNTPGMEDMTPQNFVENLVNMDNVVKRRADNIVEIQSIENQINALEQEMLHGQINEQQYWNQLMDLETKMQKLTDKDAKISQELGSNAFYNFSKNQLGIDPFSFLPEEYRRVVGHEMGGHGLQAGVVTNLDKELEGLKLKSVEGEQLGIPQLSTEKNAYNKFGPGREDYMQKTIDYWLTGSQGTEKLPHVMELREDMLEKGILKHDYDQITPEMVRKHFNDYRRQRGEKYPLRVYDIMEESKGNFKLLSGVMNRMAGITGATIATGAALNE